MLLKCLSIQQPFVELIMDGRKRVENRSWTWMKDRNWAKDGPVVLGIHASTRMAVFNDEVLDELFPGWDEGDGVTVPVGCVVGVVDLVCICRPRELPADLRDHDFVNDDPDSWSWVLSNPRRLTETFAATGNARLFNVEVPDELLPTSVINPANRRT
jgi:hypothetical protein